MDPLDPIAATPVVATPVAAVEAPVVSAVPSPAIAPTEVAPAATPEPVAAPEPAAEPVAEPVASKPSLLETAAVGEGEEAPVDDKPIEVAPVEGEAPVEGAEPVVVEPVVLEPIKYDTLKLPEGVTAEPGQMEAFTNILGESRLPPELGQKFLDLHVAEVGQLAARVQQANYDNWTKMQDTWVSEFRSDREIGGNRELTTLRTCAAVIEQYAGSPEQQAQLRKVFTDTGAGNNPAVIRFLNNIGRVLSEGRPVTAPKPPPPPSTRQARRYGQS